MRRITYTPTSRRKISWQLFFAVLTDFLPLFLICLLILTGIVYTQQLLRQADFFALGLDATITIGLLLNTLPGVLIITVPFSVLLACLLVLNKMAGDSELISVFASGIRPFQAYLPFFVLALLASLGTGLLAIDAAPQSLRDLRDLRYKALSVAIEQRIRPLVPATVSGKELVFVRNVDRQTARLKGLFIIRLTDDGKLLTISAAEGNLQTSQDIHEPVRLVLNHGLAITSADMESRPETITRFEQQYVRFASTQKEANTRPGDFRRETQELKFTELLQRTDQLRAEGNQESRFGAFETHKRIALGFSPLVLVMLALALAGGGTRSRGRASAFIYGALAAVSYYLLLTTGQSMAWSGRIPAVPAAWGPNLITAGLAFLLARRRRTPMPSFIWNALRWPGWTSGLRTRFAGIQGGSGWGVGSGSQALVSGDYIKFSFIALFSLYLLSIAFTLLDLMPSVSRNRVPAIFVWRYLTQLSPLILGNLAPVGAFFGLLATFIVLCRTNQTTALYAHGISRWQIATPLILLTMLLATGLLFLSETILPVLNRAQDDKYNQIKGRNVEQTVVALGRRWVYGKNNILFGYKEITPQDELLKANAWQFKHTDGILRRLSYVDVARYGIDGKLAGNAALDWTENLEAAGNVQTGGAILSDNEDPGLFRRTVNEAGKMNYLELSALITQLHGIGAETRSLDVDLEKKKSVPVNGLLLPMLALPFCLSIFKRRITRSLIYSVAMFLGFWLAVAVFDSAGRVGYLPIPFAVWGAQALFASLTCFMLFRIR
ncbi:MAG: LptF/LptG family permease [Blastocatellia bacterium]